MNDSTSIEREMFAALVPVETADRPGTRADCRGQRRPCPWVSCRYHLALDINAGTGSIHLNAGARDRRTLPLRQRLGVEEWLDHAADAIADMPETCALDVAERGGISLAAIADLLGINRERARQIESDALANLRVGIGPPEEPGCDSTSAR